MLTRKQKDLLLLIRERLDSDGVPPSFDEMKTAIGLRSKSGIHRLIMGLEERGFIKRIPHRARALEILRMPDGLDDRRHAKQQPANVSRKSRMPGITMPDRTPIVTNSINLPLYGRIAAGTPIEALRDTSATIEVPAGLLASVRGGSTAEHYALEVSGDSMIEAGIMDGDKIIIRNCDTAENGSIVVALVDDTEATLKYLERRGNQIALIPANRNYQIRLLPAAQIKIQGRLVGLLRQY